jgi:hypothetical protein
MSLASAKVPVILATGIVCLAAGAGGTIVVMESLGYLQKEKERPAATKGGDAKAPNMKGPPGPPGFGAGPGGGGGAPKGGGRGGGGAGGGFRPSAKSQLAALVVKLDALSSKPLTIKLDEKQFKGVREQLTGLGEKDVLEEEEAQKRLDALLELLKDQRAVLEAAGYRWPGGMGGGRPPAPPPNPFKEGENAEHLKSLLGKEV